MNRSRLATLVLAALAAAVCALTATTIAGAVQVIPHPVAPRVDVLFNGKPFGSYYFLSAMARPSLFPLRAANGAAITRAAADDVPDSPRAGFWFAHGAVNGIDFVEGTGARIVHRRVVEAMSSDASGQLTVQTAWTAPEGSVQLVEDTWFTFRDSNAARIVDRVTRLAAVNGPVRLGRTPRALIGLQLANAFDARSVIRGARGESWIAAGGVIDGGRLAVALLDHPHNPGFPNVLRMSEDGTLELAPAAEAAVEAQGSLTFRCRLLIGSATLDRAAIERAYQEFAR